MTLMTRKNIADDPRLALVSRELMNHRRAADDLEWQRKTHYPDYKMHRDKQGFYKRLQEAGVQYYPTF